MKWRCYANYEVGYAYRQLDALMDELDQIRERIARHTEEQRTVWLHQHRSRYSTWLFISGVFAVLVMVTAILAKSLLFGVLAAFLSMFTWNRRTECKRLERWLSRPTLGNQQERRLYSEPGNW